MYSRHAYAADAGAVGDAEETAGDGIGDCIGDCIVCVDSPDGDVRPDCCGAGPVPSETGSAAWYTSRVQSIALPGGGFITTAGCGSIANCSGESTSCVPR